MACPLPPRFFRPSPAASAMIAPSQPGRSWSMRGTRVTPHTALALLLTASLRAQTAPTPVAIANKLDTPQARVYVATLQPHMPSRSPNGHATNRVLVYLDDGAMTRQDGTDTQTIT